MKPNSIEELRRDLRYARDARNRWARHALTCGVIASFAAMFSGWAHGDATKGMLISFICGMCGAFVSSLLVAFRYDNRAREAEHRLYTVDHETRR